MKKKMSDRTRIRILREENLSLRTDLRAGYRENEVLRVENKILKATAPMEEMVSALRATAQAMEAQTRFILETRVNAR